MKIKLLVVLVLLAAIIGAFFWRHNSTTDNVQAQTSSTSSNNTNQIAAATNASEKKTTKTKPAPQPKTTVCDDNTADKALIVSISQQHMWACGGTTEVYQSAVTTGATAYGDGTPTGTWEIQGKQTDRYLTGSDDRGSWNDFVNYWMPYNGDYGFHDATWQNFAFGDLTKYTTGGSHGCVHLPLATAKWVFNWAPVGTTVTIES
ncbi:MAG TPA: L,D-transpeptidase [Candidatus Saccharimonadales bacterium]|nr:L,D-transpeptidase [Candidatus Saccharimonadales bacterium]